VGIIATKFVTWLLFRVAHAIAPGLDRLGAIFPISKVWIFAIPELSAASFYHQYPRLKLFNPVRMKKIESLGRIKERYGSVDLVAPVS
jgi:hypothetical protein